jgi:UDP-N-acetylmuramoyl-tripeptide--D-alanyl-D-alanine ligase
MMLSELARVTRGRQIGADVTIAAVSIDTRTLEPGALFVALDGPNFDGHDYLGAARERGARAALVTRQIDIDLPQVVVPQTRRALGEMAAWWRSCHDVTLVAVTGSNGKTTVKEMLAAIFNQVSQHVLATRGNLNNDLGVPLTLMRLRDSHEYAVVEMGMNNPGELTYLTGLAKPDIAVITNAAAAHLEGLGGLEAVARAKGEILAGLSAAGTAVLNADDMYFALWRELAGERRVISFALEQNADVTAEYELLTTGARLSLTTPSGAGECTLQVAGRHNVLNALAAAAAASAAGVNIQAILGGLSNWQGVKGRLQRQRIGELQLIDDSYNANPASLQAGIEVLAAQPGTRILVMGDMMELGEEAAELHAAAGRRAADAGIDFLYGLGDMTVLACRAFGDQAKHFSDHARLAHTLKEQLDSMAGPVTVLVKGSRSMQMERIVAVLSAEPGGH